MPICTYFDVVSLRDPDVVNRGEVGGAGSHVCAGEVSSFFWTAVLALMLLEEPPFIL